MSTLNFGLINFVGTDTKLGSLTNSQAALNSLPCGDEGGRKAGVRSERYELWSGKGGDREFDTHKISSNVTSPGQVKMPLKKKEADITLFVSFYTLECNFANINLLISFALGYNWRTWRNWTYWSTR